MSTKEEEFIVRLVDGDYVTLIFPPKIKGRKQLSSYFGTEGTFLYISSMVLQAVIQIYPEDSSEKKMYIRIFKKRENRKYVLSGNIEITEFSRIKSESYEKLSKKWILKKSSRKK